MNWKILTLLIYICFKYKAFAGNVLEKCAAHYILKNHYIIDTKNSLRGGASFINVYHTKDARSCSKICCNLAMCSVVVYEPNQNYKNHQKNCFAFDCGPEGSLCQFAPHNNFLVLISTKDTPSIDFLKSNYDSNSDKSFYQDGILPVKKHQTIGVISTSQTQSSQTTSATPTPTITTSSIASTFAQQNPTKPLKFPTENNLLNLPSIDYDYQRLLDSQPNMPEDSFILPYNFYQPKQSFVSPLQQIQIPQNYLTKNTTKYNDLRHVSLGNTDILYNHRRKSDNLNDLSNPNKLYPYGQFVMPNQNNPKFYQPQEILQSSMPRSDDNQIERMYPRDNYLKEVIPHVNQQLYWPPYNQQIDNNLYDIRNGFNQRLSKNSKLNGYNLQSNFANLESPLKSSSSSGPCNPAYEFQCESGQPRCIAIYDVCDGIPHCQDGSDEKDCQEIKSDAKMDSNTSSDLAKGNSTKLRTTLKTMIRDDPTIPTAEPSSIKIRPRDKGRAALAFAIGLCLVFAAITITCLTCASRLVKGPARMGSSKNGRFYVQDSANCNGRATARKPLLSDTQSENDEDNGGPHKGLTEPGRVLADDADKLMADGPDPLDLDMRYGTADHMTVIMDPSDRKQPPGKLGSARLGSKRRDLPFRKPRVSANGNVTYTPTALYTG